MKKFLIAGSGLAAVAAAGSAGAVDVTLGGSIEMGIEYGLGKKVDGFMFDGSKAYQNVSLSIAAAGTTDAGMKFGGSFALSTADELKLNLYDDANAANAASKKTLVKLVNTKATAGIKGAAYNVSGGQKISSGAIVSVKINSGWQAAKTKVTDYTLQVGSIANDSAICKLAGRADMAMAATLNITRAGADGKVAQVMTNGDVLLGGYLPAGRLAGAAAIADATVGAPVFTITANTSKGVNPIGIGVDLVNAAGDVLADTAVPAIGDATDGDKFAVGIMDANAKTDGVAGPLGAAGAAAGFNDSDDVGVLSAAVYVGPFMSVKMTSSTTKMVVGAVCVTNDIKASSTKAYLDLASRVMQVGAASIYIEGGFGKLTLQQGDYKGKVSAIGEAGDQATITSSGLVALLEGASFMGMNGYAAVDVGSIKAGSRPNYMLGTNVDLMGLSIAVEMEDEPTTVTVVTNTGGTAGTQDENKYIDHWDMGTTYTLGDMQIDGVLDSAGDWALKASGSVAGFTATSVIENVKKGQNKKAGLSIDTTLATSFNGINVSIGLDEDLEYSLSGSYSIGNSGLAITAAYSSEDNGGKVSAKLSF